MNKKNDNVISKLGQKANELAKELIEEFNRHEEIDYEKICYRVGKATCDFGDKLDCFYQYIMDHEFNTLLKQVKSGELKDKDLEEIDYFIDTDDYMDVFYSPIDKDYAILNTMNESVKLFNRILRELDRLNITDENREIILNMHDLIQEMSFNFYHLSREYKKLLIMLGMENKEILDIKQAV